MEPKLLFLDIDGTLTFPGSLTVPESALQAIRKAQANGHKIFLCTGRCLGKFRPLLDLGFDGAIGSAGGYILYGSQVLYDHPMEDRKRDRVVETVLQAGSLPIIETLNRAYASKEALALLAKGKAANASPSELARWRAEVKSPTGFRPMAEYDGSPVYKVVFIGEDPKAVPQIEKELEKEFVLCLHNILKGKGLIHGELINRDFSKGSAICRLCEYLQIPLTDTIGFGDSANDLTMLETTKVSVCMKNGDLAAKEVSDLICPSVEQDGLAAAFRELKLI